MMRPVQYAQQQRCDMQNEVTPRLANIVFHTEQIAPGITARLAYSEGFVPFRAVPRKYRNRVRRVLIMAFIAELFKKTTLNISLEQKHAIVQKAMENYR